MQGKPASTSTRLAPVRNATPPRKHDPLQQAVASALRKMFTTAMAAVGAPPAFRKRGRALGASVPPSASAQESRALLSSLVRSLPTDAVGPQSEQLDLPTEIPAALADARIPRSAMLTDLDITTPIWKTGTGTKVGDVYLLYVNGELFDETGIAVADLTEDPFVYPYPKSAMDLIPEGSNVTLQFQLSLLTIPGELEYLSLPYVAFFDKQAPGGAILPPIAFDEDLVRNGLTLAKLLTMPNQELPGLIPNYEYQDEYDTIELFMKLRDGGVEIPAGKIPSSRSDEIAVTFPRETLEKIQGVGTVDFYYYVTDEVGNKAGPSPFSPLDLLIDGAPETIPAPLVPGFDDDAAPAVKLVIDPDARPTLLIRIPAYDPPPLVGDSFVVRVGTHSVTAGPLKASDIGNDPVLDVAFPYNLLFPDPVGGAEPNPIFTADVSYDVVRAGFLSPSEVKSVDFDLSLAGGVDPLPDPDPGIDPPLPPNPNDNLDLPVLTGKSGAENDLPPDDVAQDATGTIPWLNLGTPKAPALQVGDVVQLYIGGDKVGPAHTVVATDAAPGVDITIPTADLEAHSGTGKLWYSVVRTLASGDEVTAESGPQTINLQSTGSLPGGGTLFEATFIEGVSKRTYAINLEDARSGGGCPVRIRLDQANLSVGNTITWSFKGVVTDGVTPPEDLPAIPRTEVTNTHDISKEDMVPREDATLPKPPGKPIPATRPFTDILVATQYILPCTDKSGVFIYNIKNENGEAPKPAVDLVRMDVRVP